MDLDNTPHGKFVKNQSVIRHRASFDEKNYASVCVRAVDNFKYGHMFLNIYRDKLKLLDPDSLDVQGTENRVMEKFAISLSASEIFALIPPCLYHDLKSLCLKLMTREGGTVEHDARIVYSFLLSGSNPDTAMKFLNESRKKFPAEPFFHRGYSNFIKDNVEAVKVMEEIYKLFPENPEILHDRAVRMMKVAEDGKYDPIKNWLQYKNKIGPVKEAFREFFKFAPRDHRQFAPNQYVMAHISLKYAQPAAQLMGEDLQEICTHFQCGLQAEQDILPCFLPFDSTFKKIVERVINIGPTTHINMMGSTVVVSQPQGGPVIPRDAEIMPIGPDMRKPDRRRTDICVAHRRKLKEFQERSGDQDFPVIEKTEELKEKVSKNSKEEDLSQKFKEISLSEMNKSGKKTTYPSRMITLTVVEDPYYSETSGSLEMVVVDPALDIVNLHLDVGGGDDPRVLMKKFQYGSKWTIKNPQFEGNSKAKDGFIRGGHEDLIEADDGEEPGRCRYCWKFLDPGQHCSRCKRSSYCGVDCQKKDWKYLKHGLICSEHSNNFYK